MRRFLASVFTLTALVLAPVPASAQQTETFVSGKHVGWLGINDESRFWIHVSDGVKDGCWTNAEAAKNAVAIELQRSGYKVSFSAEGVLNGGILLSAIGYGTTNFTCVVNYELNLLSTGMSLSISSGKHKMTSWHSSEMWGNGGVMSGPKSGINQRIKDAFVELAQKLLLDIPKERREVLKAVREAAEKNKDKNPEAYRYWMAFPE